MTLGGNLNAQGGFELPKEILHTRRFSSLKTSSFYIFVTFLAFIHLEFLLFARAEKINILRDLFIMNESMQAIRINGSFIISCQKYSPGLEFLFFMFQFTADNAMLHVAWSSTHYTTSDHLIKNLKV